MFKTNKCGVEYTFNTDNLNAKTKNWLINNFHIWEPFTFSSFSSCANTNKVAIDIGAWIGLTGIWLSKNFRHIICIEADKVSANCLKENLDLSECKNYSIINKAIYNENTEIIFGNNINLSNSELNESTSQIKSSLTSEQDYKIQTICFKDILAEVNNQDVGLVKIDIEGGEEFILDDVVNYCKVNSVPLLISFHIGWWKNKNINNYEYLFKGLKGQSDRGDSVSDIYNYLNTNTFATLFIEFKD